MKNGTFYMLYSGSNGTAVGHRPGDLVRRNKLGQDGVSGAQPGAGQAAGTRRRLLSLSRLERDHVPHVLHRNEAGWFGRGRGQWPRVSKDLTTGPGTRTTLSSRPDQASDDSGWVGFASVVFDAPLYRMWYTGNYAANSSTPTLAAIDYASSSDGLHWTKFQANPVLAASLLKNASYYTASYPSVIEVGPGTFLMVFSLNLNQAISYATSRDGLGWASSGQPLISYSASNATWDSQPSFASAMLNGSELVLYYDGGTPGAVGLAFCPLVIILSTTTSTAIGPTTTITSTQTVSYYPPTTTISSSVPVWAYGVMAVLLVVGLAVGYVIKRPIAATRTDGHASYV